MKIGENLDVKIDEIVFVEIYLKMWKLTRGANLNNITITNNINLNLKITQ